MNTETKSTDELAQCGAWFVLRDDGYFAEVGPERWRWCERREAFVRIGSRVTQRWATAWRPRAVAR